MSSRSEHVFTLCGRDSAALDDELRFEAAARNARMLGRVGGAGGRAYDALRSSFSKADGGIAWLHGDRAPQDDLSYMQAFAISGTPLIPVFAGGREAGCVYEDEFARYCFLVGVLPARHATSREAQANEVFELLDAALKEQGFCFGDTIRTWFYLDRMLEWYSAFNTVRTAFFTARDVFDRMVPASTGIGAANPQGAALSGSLLAVQPKTGVLRVLSVPSPLQCAATDYRSSFSRAVELTFPAYRSLLISGTASIAMDGTTAHAGDPSAQVDLTMRVVTALLDSRGMDWKDVTRGIAYFKNAQDRPLLEAYLHGRGLPALPLATVCATVCRHDLLFEIEVDAVKLS